MKWEDFNLDENLIKALYKLNYDKPLEVQQNVIPLLLDNKNVTVKSQTGTGKTASFGIPLCQMIDWSENEAVAMILTPTRELALQIKNEISNISVYKRLKVAALIGRQPISKQIIDLKQKTHIIVGTPGRILDHLKRNTIDISKIKYFVLDEADEMLNMGFLPDVDEILKMANKQKTTLLFSATMPIQIVELARRYQKKPVIIEMQAEEMTNRINHFYYRVEDSDKKKVLVRVIMENKPETGIIFCKTQIMVDEVHDYLEDLEISVDEIHGGMEQDDRLRVMKNFKKGKFRFLVATDVAARGIDIEKVDLVVNYDMPNEKENYIHRLGRSARVESNGKGVSFVAKYDKRILAEVEELINDKIEERSLFDLKKFTNMEISKSNFLKASKIEKVLKDSDLKQEITKLYINCGKQKKLRKSDILGAILQLDTVKMEDVGIISVLDSVSYVDILNNKGDMVRKFLNTTTIKGRKMKVVEAKEWLY